MLWGPKKAPRKQGPSRVIVKWDRPARIGGG
ncbi:hypothetical protein RPYSC3_23770 [Rhodopseudomonas palustris]|nr:hypothetical protein RPYSC3_23770 [Rhodopseudomonas palustris]